MVVAAALAVGISTAMADGIGSLPTVTVGSHEVHYYEVKRGDNLYSIAERLGVTRHYIVSNNPSAADGVKPLMRLYFPKQDEAATSVAEITRDGAQAIPTTHIVGKGESIYGISALYGVPVETLIRLNPQADQGIKPGQTLRLADPVKATQSTAVTAQATPADKPAPQKPENPKKKKKKSKKELEAEARMLAMQAEQARADSIAAARAAFVADSIAQALAAQRTPVEEMEASVAVLLPFQLDESRPGRSAQLNTEFFRGMVLAAEKESRNRSAHINIRAFDTCGNTDSVRMLMTLPEVYTADIIIAPDQPEHLAVIEEGAPQAQILNFLSVRDESYLDHPNMIQANIPHDDMYDTAIKGFMKFYEGYRPVFLRRDGGATDKDEFVAALKRALDAAGREYDEVVFNISLEDEHLADISPDTQPVVFVPNTSRPAEFNRYADALAHLRERSFGNDTMALWGYPEWVTFTGDALGQLGALNTTIYSRFYIVADDFEARAVADDYRRWYGIEMTDAIPSQGILGYDAGTYAIRALRAMAEADTDRPVLLDFEGVQNILHLERASDLPEAGLVNRSLFFIHYLPGGRVEKTRL